MKREKLKGFAAGFLVCILLFGITGTALATGSYTTLKNVLVGGISIVIDGKKLHPTDVNGNTVEPMIYNGTTYLPVRAVSSALGKAVYWDGPTYTVYLGNMNGKLEYPTDMLKDMTSIADKPYITDELTDNYGNHYGSAICNTLSHTEMEYLLNMKYSHFKGTLYIPEGETGDQSVHFTVTADGKLLYTSPDMTKTSRPVSFDVKVTGYNDVKIEFSHESSNYWKYPDVCLADAGFYQ